MDFLASHIELPEGHFGFLPCFSGSICSAPPGKASMRLSFPDDWLEGRRSSELHEGWLLHPIHKNSGDDFGMVYGIGFPALNIHTHIYIYTWIHMYTYIYIYIPMVRNKWMSKIRIYQLQLLWKVWILQINFVFIFQKTCSTKFNESATKVQRSLNGGRLDGPRSRHRRRHPGT